MLSKLNDYLGVTEETLKEEGVFNAIINVDTNLFLDPHLLKTTTIPELKKARTKIEEHFKKVLKLIKVHKYESDRPWKEAKKLLIFRELRGVSIGYGKKGNGSAIGPVLAEKLLKSAIEVVNSGVEDPEIFELLGIFEEGFGADRLSDMTISIIKEDLFKYSDRVAKNLHLKKTKIVLSSDGVTKYNLAEHPNGKDALIFLPEELLRDLPVAYSWEDIGRVAAINQAIRQRLNQLIGKAWKKKSEKKLSVKEILLKDPTVLKELVLLYKNKKEKGYDLQLDRAGEYIWYEIGQKIASDNPIALSLNKNPSLSDIVLTVEKIIEQYKKNIEQNGLKEHLYRKNKNKYKVLHERFSQRLFFSVADTYCAANNLDLSPEVNSGNGSVDFKVSNSYKNRIVIEIKLSSNSHTFLGFKNQLPAYQESENKSLGYYVVIQVTERSTQINRLKKLVLTEIGKDIPKLYIIDGRLKPSASKRS